MRLVPDRLEVAADGIAGAAPVTSFPGAATVDAIEVAFHTGATAPVSVHLANRGDPPPGLIHPIRGTGLAWAMNEAFYQNLGWAKTQQRGFCARVQNFVGGFIVQESGLGSCFDGKSNQEQTSRATEAEFDFRFLKAYHSNQWSRN